MSKIGILGGTFDPIHYAHLYMGALAADEMQLDRVIYVPNGSPPHKDKVNTPGALRLEMTRLATQSNPAFEVSDYEIAKDRICYTVDTIRYFRGRYPDAELFFIVGEDSLGYMEEWYDAVSLFALCKFIVIGRGGVQSDINAEINRLYNKYGFDCHYLKGPELDISSDGIRSRLRLGKTVRYLLPDELLDYINQNKIYV